MSEPMIPKLFPDLSLLDEENFAEMVDVVDVIKDYTQQAAGGWGVRPYVRVALALARELDKQRSIAAHAEDYHKKLKAEQLSHGRTKAQLRKVQQNENEDA